MSTAPLESSFHSQGTPRMGYINILRETKCGKGFWHITTSCKECFHHLPQQGPHPPSPYPPPPPPPTTAGSPWELLPEPLSGFYGKIPKSQTLVMRIKEGNLEGVTAKGQMVSPLQGAQECHTWLPTLSVPNETKDILTWTLQSWYLLDVPVQVLLASPLTDFLLNKETRNGG